jgi:methyltransferase
MVNTDKGYLLLVGAFALERCFELVLSRRNTRLALKRGAEERGQGHYWALVTLHTLFLLSCAGELLLRHPAFPKTVGYLALGGLATAQFLRYWVILSLRSRWNTRILFVPGDRPVVSGPYRFLRHPNYLAVVVEIFCLPAVRALWITAAVFSALNAALLWVRIRAEETALGPVYAHVFSRIPKLLPGGRRG